MKALSILGWASALLTLALPLSSADAKLVLGQVVSETGQPLAGVRIDHYGASYSNIRTNGQGEFEVRTNAPVIVLRKAGFAAIRVRTDQEQKMPIVMTTAALSAPRCSRVCDPGLRNSSLCFPLVKGVTATKPGRDVDYTVLGYVARIARNKGAIMHGEGPSWSKGLPSDRDVWESTEYSERDYPYINDDLMLIDAKGKSPDGTRWRYVGIFGESASYNRISSAAVSSLLDHVLDGVCLIR
jgi:hypothetical protein